MANTRIKILDLAEQMLSRGGYHGFSFRDIAASIGIKSSSVHHHFATKEQLTRKVVDRYVDNFFVAIGESAPKGATTQGQIKHYSTAFQTHFTESEHSCLCGVLSNERLLLPSSVIEMVDSFANRNVDWLDKALAIDRTADPQKRIEQATLIYCAHQGAMSISALKQDDQWIKSIANAIDVILSS